MKVKVLLKKTISNLGKRNSIQRVKMGYAKNYLMPQGLAELATPAVVEKWEAKQKEKQAKETKEAKEARKLSKQISETTLTIRRKLTKTGKIFGSIKAKDIASRLAKKGIEIEKGQVELEKPLKKTGQYQVPINLDFDIKAQLTVVIERKP